MTAATTFWLSLFTLAVLEVSGQFLIQDVSLNSGTDKLCVEQWNSFCRVYAGEQVVLHFNTINYSDAKDTTFSLLIANSPVLSGKLCYDSSTQKVVLHTTDSPPTCAIPKTKSNIQPYLTDITFTVPTLKAGSQLIFNVGRSKAYLYLLPKPSPPPQPAPQPTPPSSDGCEDE